MTPSPRLAVLGAVLGVLLGGCAAGPGAAPPTGVDELVVPAPAVDPDDFVAGVDNPWLPLQPGSEWVYRSTDEPSRTMTVTVARDTRDVAGVPATEVRTVPEVAGEVSGPEAVEWYAQDRAGNVWLLGAETATDDSGAGDGSWEAGVDGARAGLAMAAEPRVGDGYVREAAPGVAEDRVEVIATDGTASVPYAGFAAELLVLEVRSPLEPSRVEEWHFARGVGLVLTEPVTSGDAEAELVSFSPG